ncbi:LysR family transcriptional regulator, partial [Rhizobium sp. BR5]
PLYSERYHLIAAAGTPLADQESVTWKQVASLRLCL